MKNQHKIKVLVVEDDANWREALCKMYEEILPRCNVNSASSGPDALRMIENGEKFDLLSLDINLGITHPKTGVGQPDLKVNGADGRSVLRRFHELKACNGVIVITALAYDTTLTLVIPEEEELRRVKMALHIYLEELFPNRNLYLQKMSGYEIEKCVSLLKEQLTRKEIISLCKASPGLLPPYTIKSSGDYVNPTIWIKPKEGEGVQVTKEEDARLLLYLCEVRKEKYRSKPYVEKKTVCAIYRKIREEDIPEKHLKKHLKSAQTDIDSFRRRLKNKGIDPEFIIKSVRGKGWELCPDVTIRGCASVDKRSSGLGKRHNRYIDIDDLPADNPPNPFEDLNGDSD